ncbi:MAG: hypothetical protein KC609_08600, partial [Myxococcales bacterium]|nr:hypothetical protein [Myxococcales bacterium]
PPAVRDGCAHFVFFTRGVRYLDDATRRRWDEESPLQPLAAELDRANAFDDNAVQLRSGDKTPIGFVPRYYACEIAPYLQRGNAAQVELLRHNPAPASVRERFLVRLSLTTEPGWSFARSAAYDSLAPSGTQSVDGEAAA